MKIAFNWLKEYIDVDLSVHKVAEILTQTGLEVEGVEEVETIKGGLKGLLIGEVVEVSEHPNADKLKLTRVNVGEKELLPIVCGAPNVDTNQKVVVAPVNTTIHPLTGESFQIKKAKIRGEVSMGMICAEDEIGLGTDHDGIMVLPQEAPIGMTASEYFKVESDFVIEIGLTPNRNDAMSHIGVARDLLAALKHQNEVEQSTPLKWPKIADFKVDNESFTIPVEVENSEACPRYCGITLSGVEVKESPDWLKNKLRSIGLNPHNNVVDVTNFVLHEMGQPLHAFDADQIAGKKVVVKTLPGKTKFETLDEVTRELHSQDLMICNANEGMCIAGVFGGISSGVTEKTQNVFLESAYFNPVWVRKTAKRHGLNTDASFRFERGVDPNLTMTALKRAAQLIKEVAGGKISSLPSDSHPEEFPAHQVEYNIERANRLIGKEIDENITEKILASLDIEVKGKSGNIWKLVVPPYRADVTREADVVEEVLRIYGYNEVPIPEKIHSSVSHNAGLTPTKLKESLASFLTGMGFREAMSNSLTSAEKWGKVKGMEVNTFVPIENPLSSELNIMRPNLLANALESVGYNLNRKVENLRFFEMGKGYQKVEKTVETELMSITLCGDVTEETWIAKTKPVDLFYLKGVADALLGRYGLSEGVSVTESEVPFLSYGLDIHLSNGKKLLYLGEVSPDAASLFEVKAPVFYLELNREVLYKALRKQSVTVNPIPKYPSVRRDLALLVDKSTRFADMKAAAEKQERKLLRAVNLFDVYEGKNLPPDKKSYAISFVFRDDAKTLKDKQIEKMMDKLLKTFQTEFNATLR